MLLYNYAHYSDAYSEEVGINTSYTDRYSVFPESGIKTLGFTFPETSGNYVAVQRIVNRENGSAFDNFVDMGAVEPLSCEEISYLKRITEPKIIKERMSAPVNLDITLQPLEIRLIELYPVTE